MGVRVRMHVRVVGVGVRVVGNGKGVNTYLLRGILLLKSPGLMAADNPFLKNTEGNFYTVLKTTQPIVHSSFVLSNLTKILQIVTEVNEKIAKKFVFWNLNQLESSSSVRSVSLIPPPPPPRFQY